MPLTIEQIRAARTSLPKRTVPTPDLGGDVWVRALTLREVRDIQELQAKASTKAVDVSRKIVEFSACNEDGSALFVGEDKSLIETLTWGTIQALSEAAMEMSGLKKPDAADGDDDDPKK